MKTIKAESYWVKGSKKGYIKSHVISPPSKNELLIKTLYSGISFGTEKIVFTGDVPTSQRELMRCPYQEGSFGRDVKYGYINIGKVIDGKASYLNKNIFSLFPHQSKYVLREDEALIIPKNIPLKRCLLIPNMETAINGIWDTLPSLGDKILIVGAGIVGCLTAYLANKLFGNDVLLVDKDIQKKSIAKKLNLEFTSSIPKTYKANIIYECSGNAKVLNNIQKNISKESKLCILSWYGNQISKIKMGEEFFSKRASIKFSQVSSLPENRLHNWNHFKRRELAIEMLNDKKLDILIDKKVIDFRDLPSFFGKNLTKNYMCKVVKY